MLPIAIAVFSKVPLYTLYAIMLSQCSTPSPFDCCGTCSLDTALGSLQTTRRTRGLYHRGSAFCSVEPCQNDCPQVGEAGISGTLSEHDTMAGSTTQDPTEHRRRCIALSGGSWQLELGAGHVGNQSSGSQIRSHGGALYNGRRSSNGSFRVGEGVLEDLLSRNA